MNSPQANLWTVGRGKALLHQGGLRGEHYRIGRTEEMRQQGPRNGHPSLQPESGGRG